MKKAIRQTAAAGVSCSVGVQLSPIYGFKRLHRSNLTVLTALLAFTTNLTLASLIHGQAPAAETAPATEPAAQIVVLSGSEDAERILKLGTDEAIQSLVRVLNEKNNLPAKLAVCQAIISTRSEAKPFIEPLLALAQSAEPQLSAAALTALSHFADPVVAQRTLDIKVKRERQELLEAMRQADRRIYELLPEDERLAFLEALLNKSLAVRRVTALEILHAQLPTRKPQDSLLKKVRELLQDEDPMVVRGAVVVLRDLRQTTDAALLRNVLEVRSSPDVRIAVFQALGYLADPESIRVCATELDNPNPKVASQAAASIGRLAGHNPGPGEELRGIAIQALLKREEAPLDDALLRTNLIEAMAKIAAPEFATVFIRHLNPAQEPEAAIRQSAVRGLAALGSAEHLPSIIAAMNEDTEARVREAAAVSLGTLAHTADVLLSLRDRLSDESEAVQKAAWTAYFAVVAKLAPEDRMRVLDSWSGSETTTLGRRVELLHHLAKVLANENAPAPQRAAIFEQAGDGLSQLGNSAEAATSYVRALEILPLENAEARIRAAGKAFDAFLAVPDLPRMLTEAAKLKQQPLLDLAAEKILQHLSGMDEAARKVAYDHMAAAIPDLFGEQWAPKFKALLPTAEAPSTSTAPSEAS